MVVYFGLETEALTKRQELELEVAELKMRLSLGVTRMDSVWNEHIRGIAKVGRFGDKVRGTRRRWIDMCRRGTMNILVEGCLRWSYQSGGQDKDQRGDSWL